MKLKNNKFIYETTDGTTYGYFNIYQGKDGKIYLQMASNFIELTIKQVNQLRIFIFGLKDNIGKTLPFPINP